MEFRVLGPVEMWSAGKQIDAGHVKQRSVLAVLLLDLGQVVPIDVLIDRVWGDSPPSSVRNNLYAYVARLRAAIASAGDDGVTLTRRSGGYLIEAAADRVDLFRFQRLVAKASANAAAADGLAASLLRDALELWHGSALTGLTSPWLNAMRDAIEQQRIGAVLDLGDIALRHGEQAALAGTLAKEAIAHPGDERLAGLLMLSLYRSGRQADALRWYEQVRRHLADELGADPGPELAALHLRVLRNDPALAGAVPAARDGVPVPRELPPDIWAFTGRAAELAELDRLAADGAGEATAVVISAVSGTAGVGKTALAVHWAHRVAHRFPDGQLYVNLRGYDPDKPMAAAEALAGFLRALGVPGTDIPLEEAERAARYRSLLAGRRMLVLLDNASEVAQVRPLLPGAPTCVTLVTSRDSLAGLVARDGARRLDLELLPLAEAIDLLRALIGSRVDANTEAAVALAGQCARLPLALRVAAELVVSRPAAPLSELVDELADQQRRLDLLEARGDVRTAVRGVFSWSYRHLDSDLADAFRLLGLHPTVEVELYAAAALLGVGHDRAADLLGRLARAHLIRPVRPDWFSMHDLLRVYAAELGREHDSDARRREALSRLFDYYLYTAAQAMDTLYPAERPVRPATTASAADAPPLSEPSAARVWLDAHRDIFVPVAAQMAAGWPGLADRLVAIVFRHLDSGGHFHQVAAGFQYAYRDAHSRGDLVGESEALTGLATADWRLGRYGEAETHLRQALDVCRRRGDRVGEARALGTLGNVVSRQGRYGQAIGYFEQALGVYRQTGHLVNQASSLGNMGDIDLRQGRYDRAADRHRQALELIRQAGNEIFEVYALTSIGEVELRRRNYDDAASYLTQALDLSRQAGNKTCEGYALTRLGELDLALGRPEEAASRHREALSSFRELGDRSGEADALRNLADVLLATGQPQHAAVLCDTALGLARQIGDRYGQARALDGLARASKAVADPAKARSTWQEAVTIYTELGAPEARALRNP